MNGLRLTLALSTLMFGLSACAQEPQEQAAPTLVSNPVSDLNVETIADGLSSPWSVAELPDGGYLVTEQPGTLKRINADGSLREISGLPDDIFYKQQAGLFDVVLAPSFADDGTLYLAYAYGDRKANGTAVVRARLDGQSLLDSQTIFKADPPKSTASHYGGRIVVLPDASLIVTLGEGFAYREKAQDLKSDLGKIVRIHADGSIPADNPFINTKDVRPEIYSYGHRNVQGAAYDAQSGRLWAHEHGPKGGDELNIITGGANYGWPIATTGVDYNGAQISPYKTFKGMVDPVTDWVPSIAPSGLTIYRGDLFSDWDGDALVGALAERSLHRVQLDGDKYVGEDVWLADMNARIRDVRTARDGAVLVLTNYRDKPDAGELLRLTPKP